MDTSSLVATLLNAPSTDGHELIALPDSVEWLEVRADLTGDVGIDWLRRHFRGRLIYTLRSRAEGGNGSDSAAQRRDRLLTASNHYDLVTLEGERDLSCEILAGIPSSQRLISWHGPTAELWEIRSKLENFSAVEARFYRLVTTATRPGDELVPLLLLKAMERSDVIAYATGAMGLWSRLVALSLGSPLLFGAVESGLEGSDEPNIARLIKDYGLPDMTQFKEIYGIVGNPVSHSLSPRLHNAAYGALGHKALFVTFQVESFRDFWSRVVESDALKTLGMAINGLTVASPHKETALMFTAAHSPMVTRAGAMNICTRSNGSWQAATTDPEGVVVALRKRGIDPDGKRAAVVGCGGAGRAVAAGLNQAGAHVTLVNRGPERGRLAVELLGLPFVPLSRFTVDGFSIVVNATPVGRDDAQMPFQIEELGEDAIVVDLVYGSGPTPLVEKALSRGFVVIDGREVLLTQVQHQFTLMTGREMPPDLASKILDSQAESMNVTTRTQFVGQVS